MSYGIKDFGTYVVQCVRKPKQMSTCFPTSKYTADKMASRIGSGEYVIELGAANGVVTRAILEKLPEKGKLFAFEINPELAGQLSKRMDDPRLEVIVDNAANIKSCMKERGIDTVDCIISTVPLVTMSEKEQEAIVSSCYDLLDDGNYVQIQYSEMGRKKLEKRFSEVNVLRSFINIPPTTVIYDCRK